ncbi:MAG: hypothetical protein AAFR77_05190 [Cyanobacteria bacterium J06631_2]
MSEYLELLQWILFNTVIPLMPIPLVWLGAWTMKANQKLLSILSDGQLCFYSTAISASAINDIVTKSSENNNLKGIFIGGIFFCMILSTFAYGIAKVNQIDKDKRDNNGRLAWTSILAAVTTTILVASSRNSLVLL